MKVGTLIEILQKYSPKRNVGISIDASVPDLGVVAAADNNLTISLGKDDNTVWICGIDTDPSLWVTKSE